MTSDDLSPMPEPTIEPREPNPGGVDALPEGDPQVAIPDLTPDENPAIEDSVPDSVVKEVGEGEDTSTKATRDEADSEEADKESPA